MEVALTGLPITKLGRWRMSALGQSAALVLAVLVGRHVMFEEYGGFAPAYTTPATLASLAGLAVATAGVGFLAEQSHESTEKCGATLIGLEVAAVALIHRLRIGVLNGHGSSRCVTWAQRRPRGLKDQVN